MSFNYDEALANNPFYQEIQKHHLDILNKATEDGCIICIPRIGSLEDATLTADYILEHVLVPNDDLPGTHFSTLTKKQATILNKIIILEDAKSQSTNTVRVLFDETFYVDKCKCYKVLCIDHPLNQNLSVHADDYHSIVNLHDSVQLLWSNSCEHNNLECVDRIARGFLERHELGAANLNGLKDLIESLYVQCITDVGKNTSVRDEINKTPIFLDNLRLAIETYMQHCIHTKLFNAVCNLTSYEDSGFNKTVRNLFDLQLRDLNIAKELHEFIPCAKRELNKINHFTSVLGKIECLKNTFNILSNQKLQASEIFHLTSDDLIQVFVFLIIKMNIHNWLANLMYISEFRFHNTNLTDENAFLITTLEAAIECIKAGMVLETSSCESGGDINSNQNLFHYIKLGDLDFLKSILNSNQNNSQTPDTKLCHPLCSCDSCEKISESFITVNTCDDQGRSLLHIAALHNQPHILEYLINQGADVQFCDPLNATALHCAARKGYHNPLLLLLQADADANAIDDEGNTPLHLATNNGHEKCVKALIYFTEYKNGSVNIDCANNLGNTPLHLAAKWGFFTIVHLLLQYDVNVNALNKRNQKPLDVAHNSYISKLLRTTKFAHLARGCSNSTLEKHKNLDQLATTVDDASNPSDFGIRSKNLEQTKRTDLALKSVENNDLPLMCYYLGIPMPPNSYKRERKLSSCHPLCVCEQCNAHESELSATAPTLKYAEPININTCSSEGITPLHTAAKYGRTEILRLLLDSGALINIKTFKDNYTPLHVACRFQRIQIVRELLKCGACNVDVQDAYGNTPLHYVCLRNDTRIAEVLLGHQVDCNIRNNDGKTVWQVANEKMLFNMMQILDDKCEKTEDEFDEETLLFSL